MAVEGYILKKNDVPRTGPSVDALLDKIDGIENATISKAGLMSASDKSKLDNISSGAEVNVQSDWNETDSTKDAFIKNRPGVENIPTFRSDKLITSGGVYSALTGKQSTIQTQASIGQSFGVVYGKTSTTRVDISDFTLVVGGIVSFYNSETQMPNGTLKINSDGTSYPIYNENTQVSSLPVGIVSLMFDGTHWQYLGVSIKGIDSTPTANSTNLVTSGGVMAYVVGLITTPSVQYVTVTATGQTTAATDVLPATGSADTIYKVGNWDGSRYDITCYSEYAWNGSTYIHLSTKTQIGEVFNISEYHATGGTPAQYSDIQTAIGELGENVPQNIRKGGMSVKFINSSTGKYEQWRLQNKNWSRYASAWTQGAVPITVSGNVVQLHDAQDIYPRTKANAVFFGSNTTDTLDARINQITQLQETGQGLKFFTQYASSAVGIIDNTVLDIYLDKYALTQIGITEITSLKFWCHTDNNLYFRVYQNSTYKDVFPHTTDSIDNYANYQKIQLTNNGIIVGYVIFKDITAFKSTSSSSANTLSIPLVTDSKYHQINQQNIGNIGKISNVSDIDNIDNLDNVNNISNIGEIGNISKINVLGNINDVGEVTILLDQYNKKNFTDNFTGTSTTQQSSTFSGFVFGVGTFSSSFQYIAVKVKCADWGNNTTPITKCQINFVSYVPSGGTTIGTGRTLLWSKTANIPQINPGDSSVVIFSVGDTPIQPVAQSGEDLYIEIKFNAKCALYKFASGTDYNTLPTTYFTNGNMNNESVGSGTATATFALGLYCGFSLEKGWQLTDNQITNIGERLSITPPTPTPTTDEIKISLPDNLYAVVGDTFQLFYRGCIQAVNPYNYNILVTCSKGKQFPRYFQYTPAAVDVGTTTFKLTVKNDNGDVLGEKSCNLITVSAGQSPSSQKNILCFGDSLTRQGDWCAEAYRRLTGTGGTPAGKGYTNISFCGSRVKNGAGYFGAGGWKWTDYTTAGRPAYRFYVTGVSNINLDDIYTNNGIAFTILEINITEGTGNILCGYSVNETRTPQSSGTLTRQTGTGDASITYTSCEAEAANPLWDYTNDKMTFIPYADSYCNGQIDIVYTLLSWNGQTPWRTDFTSVTNEIKKFADTLHSEFPNAKLKILGIQVNSVNGGMGSSYNATGTGYADAYGNVVTVLNQNKAYQDFANDSSYSSFVEFVNVSSQFDSEYNMPYSTYPVNTRSSITERRDTNGIHPSIDGYNQIADVVYRNLTKEICQ